MHLGYQQHNGLPLLHVQMDKIVPELSKTHPPTRIDLYDFWVKIT